MNLVIDIGNSSTKAALFDCGQLQQQHTSATPAQLIQLVRAPTTTAIILSSVTVSTGAESTGAESTGAESTGAVSRSGMTTGAVSTGAVSTGADIPDFLMETIQDTQHWVHLDAHTPLPFHNDYATPQTLGTDRIAAVAGAHFLYPHRNVLVVDMGSCITYELLDEQAHYRGGSIAPGLRMRLRAMHTFTARLPLVELDVAQTVSLVGNQTPDALRSGAVYGTVAEITHMIRMYADKFANLQVVLCGGDATYLARFMNQHYPIIPELVLIGLNTILQFNVNQSH